MNGNFQIVWKGEVIGELIPFQPDMWYLEGKWIAHDNKVSKEFEKRISKFDAKEIMSDPSKGTRILLRYKDSDIEPIHALVLSFDQTNLFMRQVFEQDAIKWLLKNVKQ